MTLFDGIVTDDTMVDKPDANRATRRVLVQTLARAHNSWATRCELGDTMQTINMSLYSMIFNEVLGGMNARRTPLSTFVSTVRSMLD